LAGLDVLNEKLTADERGFCGSSRIGCGVKPGSQKPVGEFSLFLIFPLSTIRVHPPNPRSSAVGRCLCSRLEHSTLAELLPRTGSCNQALSH
jgi:hypothetical protein